MELHWTSWRPDIEVCYMLTGVVFDWVDLLVALHEESEDSNTGLHPEAVNILKAVVCWGHRWSEFSLCSRSTAELCIIYLMLMELSAPFLFVLRARHLKKDSYIPQTPLKRSLYIQNKWWCDFTQSLLVCEWESEFKLRRWHVFLRCISLTLHTSTLDIFCR